MKKKICMLLLSSVLALSLTACGGDKDSGDSKAEAVSGDVQALVPEKEEAESVGERLLDEDLEEIEEPDELDEFDELPDEFEPAGEGREDSEWNR